MTQQQHSKHRISSQVFLGLALAGTLGTMGLSPELQRQAVAQSWPGFGKSKATKSEAAQPDAGKNDSAKSDSKSDAKATDTPKSKLPFGTRPSAGTVTVAQADTSIGMNFIASNWDDVLRRIAKDAGATLVMDKVPTGRFSRTDLRRHTKADALRILNQELEKQDFRVIEQGNFLICLYLPAARPDYARAQVQRTAEANNVAPQEIDAANGRSAPKASGFVQQAGGQTTPRRDSGLRRAAFDEGDAPAAKVLPYKPKQKTAQALSKTIFDAFRERAEIIEEGPGGLPAIRVYANTESGAKNAPRQVLFLLGVDTEGNQLQVQGSGEQTERILRLLQRLDTAAAQGDETTKLVSTKKGATAVAKSVQSAVTRLVAQNDGKGDDSEKTQTNRKDEDGKPLPDQISGIRSDVNVEAMEDIGVLILKGNQADVEAVLAIIRQIEELSAASAPDVHVQPLKHIDSEALADLLTTVYDKLKDAQGKKADQATPISVIAVVRPNAVLVLAAPRDLDSVIKLIKELDKPLAPQTAFATFTLKHAIAAQMEELLKEFFDRQGNQNKGLATRVRIVADVRTNTVVVLAQPNDLKAIAELIPQLDKNKSGAVARVEIFALKHAVADQLQQTVNQILQGVLNPAQLGQGQLGQQVLGIGGGNSSTQLRDVRSSVLEFLTQDGPEGQKVRSGILADIRVNSDDRSNTLIVTAPEESLPLVRELINRLDRPATNVAEVKHFQLRNADAASVVTLLNQLFNGSTNQNQANQGGNNQNNQGSPGIQLAAAENASSVVPLRFSVDARTNSIVSIGTAEALDVVDALILRLDSSDVRERKTKVFRLKNTPAQDIATAVQQFITAQLSVYQQTAGGGGGGQQGQLISQYERLEKQAVVQFENNTNSVLISASPRYFDELVKMVESLDEDLPQVVIQAMLVEVTLDNTDEFGIELGVQDPVLFKRSSAANGVVTPGFGFNSGTIGNSINQVGGTGAAHPSQVGAQGLSNLSVGRVNNDLGFGGLVLSAGSDSVSVLLRALAHNRKLEILSRPQIRTLHNQPGSIKVAKQVPLVGGFNQSTLGGITPVVNYADAGITLEVIPKVGPDGKIQLQVAAQKTTLDPQGVTIQGATATTGAVSSPIIDGTVAKATLTVADQETVVLGGLITKTTDTLERKVPWLGDLPVIGRGFRYDKVTQKRTELLIFLTPRVVRDPVEGEALKAIEAARLHWTECDAEEIHGPLFGLPPELATPLVEPNRFDGLKDMPPPMPMTPTAPPPVPGIEGSPMTRRLGRDSGVRPVSHEEPQGRARTK